MGESIETAATAVEPPPNAAPRAQLPDVSPLTGIPERTLQHWFREYGSYRSRRGYPVQLILDVLRDHEWDGDAVALQRALELGASAEQALERRATVVPALAPNQEDRLAALAEQCDRLATEVAAARAEQAALTAAWLEEVRRARALSTEVAALNELRGLREDILRLRAEQAQRAVQERVADGQAAPFARWRWWRRG